MLQILQTAIAATHEGNWALVNQCLHQLPLDQKGKTLGLQDEDEGKALQLALQVLKDSDFQQRWEVAKLFPKIGQRAIAPLIEILEDEEEELEIRWFVARILSQFDDSTVIIALVQLLASTEDEELSIMASQALADIGKSAIEALSHLLKAEKSRFLAVQSLSQIRRPDIIEPLLSVVNDPDSEIRALAIEALGSFHDERVFPVLVNALSDPAASVRKEAVIALGLRVEQRSCFDFVSHLKPLLYDLNPTVCEQTAIALGRVGTDEAAQALFPVLKSPATPIWLKLNLVRALSWIETESALDYFQEGLRWSDVEVCREIITVIGRQSLPHLKLKATQILIDFLNSEQHALQQPQVKQAVALSLGELGEAIALEPLLNLANDAEQTVRLHAIAALKKFPQGEQLLQQEDNI